MQARRSNYVTGTIMVLKGELETRVEATGSDTKVHDLSALFRLVLQWSSIVVYLLSFILDYWP